LFESICKNVNQGIIIIYQAISSPGVANSLFSQNKGDFYIKSDSFQAYFGAMFCKSHKTSYMEDGIS
jgi:hypothetical protein